VRNGRRLRLRVRSSSFAFPPSPSASAPKPFSSIPLSSLPPPSVQPYLLRRVLFLRLFANIRLLPTAAVFIGAVLAGGGASAGSYGLLVAGEVVVGFGTITLEITQLKICSHWFFGSHLGLSLGLVNALNRVSASFPILSVCLERFWNRRDGSTTHLCRADVLFLQSWSSRKQLPFRSSTIAAGSGLFGCVPLFSLPFLLLLILPFSQAPAFIAGFVWLVNGFYVWYERRIEPQFRPLTGKEAAKLHGEQQGSMKRELSKTWAVVWGLPAIFWFLTLTQLLQYVLLPFLPSRSRPFVFLVQN
jgi:hypothetical protein